MANDVTMSRDSDWIAHQQLLGVQDRISAGFRHLSVEEATFLQSPPQSIAQVLARLGQDADRFL